MTTTTSSGTATTGAGTSTSTGQADSSATGAGGANRTTVPDRKHSTELTTERGRTSIADAVVRKIAGVAAREVAGVHKLGTGGARAVGSVRARIPGASASVAQGVAVEVGQRQAAIDLDVVCDYGVSIVDLSQSIRRNVVSSVEGMTGLEVTEVNVAIDDVFIGDDGQEDTRRVE
ncbi:MULTISPECIES: Asp23/Gls24 family envelope stress response protein [Frankia]|uniref:Asp23/Gls24 family envelope stress response protein n=1 Tax=Frankia TaxID=1854 RepID=UPI0002FB82FB|nr:MULTISPECIES: Asp23/Gls24 family envelope stress response protein [Frankia]